MTRSSRLTAEGLERLARELVGLKVGSEELTRLLPRLESLRNELDVLEEWLEPACEPLPSVVIEDEEGPWRKS